MGTLTSLLIFPNHRAGVGTCPPTCNRGGCRGVIGPVPRPLWMRFRVTESDIQL